MMMEQDEKIRDLIIEIFLENQRTSNVFAEYHIHKILYQYKKNIEHSHPGLSKDLHYYWYKYGAYSPGVHSWLTILSDPGSRILTKSGNINSFGNEGNLFGLNTSRLGEFHPDKKVKETLSDLYSVVRSFLQLSEIYKNAGVLFNKKIYAKYAPFTFQSTFNMTYLELLRNIDHIDKSKFKKQINELRNTLCESEGELLLEESLFDDFNELFGLYVTSTNRILRYYEKGGNNYTYIKSILLPISNNVWSTFASGVRIIGKGHENDPLFDKDLSTWKNKYDDNIDKLRIEMDKYKLDVLEAVGDKGLTKIDKPESRELLSTVIGGYFSKD